MEYDLYIAGRQADLDEKIKIALNYTAIDTEEPTAEHGSFSKSVELPGTANNNEIFGQMYDVSRAILGDDPEAGGVYFDPRKRTPYVLYYNGDVNDRGYIKVDSISNTDGDISYSCTLYSDLGDFFYNLCYNEDGEELNLGDLHYGFTDYSGNTIDEDGILCKWDKDYISGGWDKIRNVFNDPTDRTVNNFLVAAPTYGGYYDDFDNDKVLVNYSSITSGSTAYRLLQPVINADSAYTPYKGWILCEATRDLDEWEARDLRSTYQRPAVKMSLILDAISDPENNGGYEVIWDDSIKNSPYYTHTFLLMNRLNFDNDPQANGLLQLNGDASTRITSTPWNKWYEMTMSTTSGSTLDLSGYKEPRMTMSLNNAFSATVAREGQTIYTSYFTKYYPIYTEDYYKTAYVYGGMVVRADVYVNGTLHSSTPNYLISTEVYNSKKGFGYEVDDWKQQIGTQLGIDPDTIVLKTNNLSWNNGDVVWDKDIRFALDLPNVSGVQVKFNVAWSWARSKSNVSACAAFQSDDRVKGWLTGTILGSTMLFNYENGDGYDTGIFDGTINPALQKSNVTKRVLFSETETPYKYLVGFTRMLGAKYKYDLGAKKIYIMPRNKYYLPYGHMIDEWIDRGQKMEVQPTLSEYKWYNYGFETPETYAAQLYNRRNKTEYGVKKVDTGYYFNNDTNNLFEDIPYTNGIPYLQQSIYYNVAVGVPQILLSPTFKGTVFCESGGTIETKETTAYGYSSSHSLSVRKDMSGDKICCFDDGNDPVEDVTNCLVFYDGFADIGNTYQISDNLPIMGTLNENPCFMALTGYTAIADADSDTPVEVKKEIIGVPRFSKYLRNLDNVYVDSLDFMKPAYTFIDNYDNYQDGICIYDRYWRAFIEDLYERNAKAVTVKMFLKEKPDVAMRKFYFFDNSIWVISEITDYDASSDEPTQVKFVKVYDTSDYTDGEIAWDDYYSVPGTIDPDSGGGSGGDEPSATTYEYRWVQDSSSGCSGYTQCYYYKKQQRPSGTTQAWVDVVPPVLSFDGDGTMSPIVIAYSSTTCGYVPPTPPSGATSGNMIIENYYKDFSVTYYVEDGAAQTPPDELENFPNERPDVVFYGSGITSVTYPWMSRLKRVVLSPTVSLIYDAFDYGAATLREIWSFNPIAPILSGTCFNAAESAGTLYYPTGSDYSTWRAALPSGWTFEEISGQWSSSGIVSYHDSNGIKQTITVSDGIIPIDAIKFEEEIRDITLSGITFLSDGGIQMLYGKHLNNLRLTEGLLSAYLPNIYSADTTTLAIPDSVIMLGMNKNHHYTNYVLGSGLNKINSNSLSWDNTPTSVIVCKSLTMKVTGPYNLTDGTGTLYYPCGSDYSSMIARLGSGWTYSCYQSGNTPYSGSSESEINACTGGKVHLVLTGGTHEWWCFPDGEIPVSQFSGRTDIASIYILSGITEVGNAAFSGCTNMTALTIPNSVTTIRQGAFSGCESLTGVTIPNSVTSIGQSAFYNCESLTYVTIPSSITTIEPWTFCGCTGLTSVTIPSSVTTIGGRAFMNCFSLTSVVIPNSVTLIGGYTFCNCKMTSVTIPSSVTTIGEMAFRGCTGLTSITISATTAPTISSNTFRGVHTGGTLYYPCSSNYSKWLSGSTYYLGYYGWSGVCYSTPYSGTTEGEVSGCTGGKVHLTLTGGTHEWWCFPDGKIHNYQYENRTNISAVTIYSGITDIGDMAFAGCEKITAVTIPNTVTYIGMYSFFGCSHLTAVTIPSSVTSIGEYAFYNCYRMASVTIPSSITTIEDSVFNRCSSLTSVVIPDSVTTIGEQAFTECHGLTSITIGNSVTTIKQDAFFNCTGITSVTIPSSVTSIGEYAFQDCKSLNTVTSYATREPSIENNTFQGVASGGTLNYPCGSDYSTWLSGSTYYLGYYGWLDGCNPSCRGNSVILHLTGGTDQIFTYSGGTIPSKAFYNRTNIASAEICHGITAIGGSAFYGCENMTSVTIANSVTTISGYAFSYCDSLVSLTIPNSVTSIGNNAFLDCHSLTAVTLPNSATSIGDYAFFRCSKLTSVTIPSTLTSIGDSVFGWCSGITSINIPNSVTSIGEAAFTNCESLTSLTIGNSVTSIGQNAFFYCCKLRTVTIPNSVTTIDRYAFRLCYKLNSVTLGGSVTSIGEAVFDTCSSLTSITVLATTAPSIGNTTFAGVHTGGTLYYPCGSDYSTWLSNSQYYLGYYNWNGVCLSSCSGNTVILHLTGGTDETHTYSGGTIPSGAFSGRTDIASAEICNGITEIKLRAFSDCSNMTSVVIPSSVTTIGKWAFWDTGLVSVTSYATTAPSISYDTFGSMETGGTLYYPCGSDYSQWLSNRIYYLGNYNWNGVCFNP